MTKQEARELRLKMGHTKQSWATALGISFSLVQKVESGERNASTKYMDGLDKFLKKQKRKKPVDCGTHT